MDLSEHKVSVDGEESSTAESLGFEELVEWKGLIEIFEDLDACNLYTMDGEELFFPILDEDDVSSGMAYRTPRDETAQDRKEIKARGCEEKDESQVPQYKTTILESRRLDGIREHYHFLILYKTFYPKASQRIHTPPANCVTTYVAHLWSGLHFPLHPLFVDICKYYRIQLGQLMPNMIRTTMGFLMACRAFRCELSVGTVEQVVLLV